MDTVISICLDPRLRHWYSNVSCEERNVPFVDEGLGVIDYDYNCREGIIVYNNAGADSESLLRLH
jgi:hypothetical protein